MRMIEGRKKEKDRNFGLKSLREREKREKYIHESKMRRIGIVSRDTG